MCKVIRGKGFVTIRLCYELFDEKSGFLIDEVIAPEGFLIKKNNKCISVDEVYANIPYYNGERHIDDHIVDEARKIYRQDKLL